MKFRDDIDPANTWVVSDTHFGHENIVGYCARPVDHDQVILEQWRAHVPDDATVLHLGDLCWKSNAWFKNIIAPRLTGARKLLILGNHDKGRPSWYRECGWQIIRPFLLGASPIGNTLYYPPPIKFEDGKQMPPQSAYSISFDHYPMDGFPSDSHFRLHGHIHNNGYYDGRIFDSATGEHGRVGDMLIPFLRNHINLSVEQTRYRPVNLGLLLDAAILGRLP
jgi:calcineurin-like phosphoesterase family protein